jgi:hypothetical protein
MEYKAGQLFVVTHVKENRYKDLSLKNFKRGSIVKLRYKDRPFIVTLEGKHISNYDMINWDNIKPIDSKLAKLLYEV